MPPLDLCSARSGFQDSRTLDRLTPEPHSQPSLSCSNFSARRKICKIKSGDEMIPASAHQPPRRPPASECRKLRVSHQLQASRRVLTPSSKRKEHQAECGSTGSSPSPRKNYRDLLPTGATQEDPTSRREGLREGKEKEKEERKRRRQKMMTT